MPDGTFPQLSFYFCGSICCGMWPTAMQTSYYMCKIRHLLYLKQVPDNINYSEEPKSSTTI